MAPQRKTVTVLTVLVLMLGINSAHCQKYPTLLSYFTAFPAKFSTLSGYVKKAGLQSVATNKTLEYMVFAPTNVAFTAPVKKYLDGLDPEMLAEFILSHAAPDLVKSDCLRTGFMLELYPDRFGRANTLIGDSDASPGRSTVRALFSAAKITKGDVPVAKGVVHEIDNVLLFRDISDKGPFYQNILDAAEKLGLKKFADAIAKYKPAASRLDIYDIAQSEGRGTAFGFTDATYNAVLKSCSEPNRLNLDRILAYSFTFDVLPLPRLANRLKFTTLSFEMEEAVVAPPGEHRVVYKKGTPYIESEYGTFKIVRTVYSRYSVLHVLDGLMSPSDRDGMC